MKTVEEQSSFQWNFTVMRMSGARTRALSSLKKCCGSGRRFEVPQMRILILVALAAFRRSRLRCRPSLYQCYAISYQHCVYAERVVLYRTLQCLDASYRSIF